MGPMLEDGRVFAAQPPLFTCKVGDTIHRAFSEEERDAMTEELTKGRRKVENFVGTASKAWGK